MYRSKEKLKKLYINESVTLREAIQAMDNMHLGFITIVDEKRKLKGIITDGDFRRAILKGYTLSDNVKSCMHHCTFKLVEKKFEEKQIRKIFIKKVIHQLPIVDENGILKDIVIETDVFGKGDSEKKIKKLGIPAVIMAGGKGVRLDPFTRILPKALIPVEGKPIIEIIMDKYANFGITNFIISVNNKAKMIKAYFEDFNKDYNISYIEEKSPLGTAGALKLLEGKIKTPLFVSNCDILVKSDYRHIYKFHKERTYSLTLIGSTQFHIVPYGVCEIENGGELKSIIEKPKYDLLVNTGMYIINHEVLKHIPKNKKFHITELIKKLKNNGEKVGVYPVSEKSWIDVGQWEEYKKAVKILRGSIS